MPWVATDKDGRVFVYAAEPHWDKDEFFPSEADDDDSDWIPATGFPNPPKPGEKREFSFAEFVPPVPAFKIGDVVRMKGCHESMVVASIEPTVLCQWTAAGGAMHRCEVPAATLELVKERT